MKSIIGAVRTSPSGRTVLALFAIPAILIGLLAMHVLAGENLAHSDTTHFSIPLAVTVGGDMTMVPSPEQGALADDCDGPCAPHHDLHATECVLALPAGAIFFPLQGLVSGWPDLRPTLEPRLLTAAASAPPTPPSLHVLSISRT